MKSEVLKRRELRKGRITVFSTMVVCMLQHGCEIWTRQKQHEDRLQVMQMQYSSRVQGVMKADEVRKGT